MCARVGDMNTRKIQGSVSLEKYLRVQDKGLVWKSLPKRKTSVLPLRKGHDHLFEFGNSMYQNERAALIC